MGYGNAKEQGVSAFQVAGQFFGGKSFQPMFSGCLFSGPSPVLRSIDTGLLNGSEIRRWY